MNSYKKYTKDIVIVGITNIVLAFRGLLLLPIISKILGATGYGIWAQVTVTLFLIACISTLNLPASLSRFLAAERNREEIKEGFSLVLVTVLGWSLLIALILFLLSQPIASVLLHDPDLRQIFQLTALIVPFWALETICLGFFRAFKEMIRYSLILISRNVIEVALLAYLILSGYGILGAVIALLIARVIVDVAMLSIIARRTGLKLPDFTRLRPYLSFSIPIIPGMLSSWVTGSSDRYVIGIFIGTVSVGIYSAGYSIGYIISYFIAPLALVLLPTLSQLYDENKINEVKTHLTYSLKYFLMLAIPSVFGLSVLARPLLLILTTPEFAPVGSLVVPLIATSFLLLGVYVIFSQIFVLIKKTRIIGIMWVGAALLNLALNITFVPRFGALAAAVTTLVCYSIVAGITIFISSKHLRFNTEKAFILKSVIASVIMSLTIWILNPLGIWKVLLVIGLGVVIYFVVLFLERGFSLNEIRFFRQLFRRD
jgi:O-antigen/teichoic acid export membrane protein